MPIYQGNQEIGSEYYGVSPQGRIYQGTQIVQGGYSIDYGAYAYYDASNLASYPGSGSTWYDLSGNGNHLTFTGSVSFTSSNGGAIDFSGSSTSVSAAFRGNPSTFDTGNQVTYICWFKPQRGTGFDGNQATLVTMPNDGGTGLPPLLGVFNTKAFGQIDYAVGDGITFTESGSVTINNWEMRAFATALTGSTKIWSPTGITTNASTGSLDPFEFKVISVGGFKANTFSDASSGYSGSIAQVVIYNRTLTDNQILDFYEATKGRYGY